MTSLAIIRLRGPLHVKATAEKTLECLNLIRKHTCIVLDDTPQSRGMLRRAELLITWGEVDDELAKKLGKITHLKPPVGGFERKGVKMPFSKGGALGYRGKNIQDLIRRML